MRRSAVFGAVFVFAVACGGPDENGPADAAVDAPPTYSISGAGPTTTANVLMTRTLSVTGGPGEQVTISLDRGSAGTISPPTLTLDSMGAGTTTYTPCSSYVSGCVGPATVQLAKADDPSTQLASEPFTLAVNPIVGEVAPCQTNANVVYLNGNDFALSGTVTDSGAQWTVDTSPDRITMVALGSTGRHQGSFSLFEVAQPLALGIYENAERETTATAGHPGLEVISNGHGCNRIAGRFQVHDYTADPDRGTVQSVTISFEQWCDVPAQSVTMLQGCFHYEATPMNPVTPPAPDPTKVAVRVLSTSGDGTADKLAVAVFTDPTGAIVQDAQVDSFGMAQAALPSGGTVTTIQYASNYEIIHTYRGVGTGDYIIVNSASPTGGAKDLMLASYTPPAGATGVTFLRACTGGSYHSAGRAILEFADGCRKSMFGMLSLAQFPTGPQQFLWQPALTHLANGNITVAGNWTPMGTATVTMTNVPANSPSLSVEWATKIDGTPMQMGTGGIATPTAGTQSVSVAYPPGAGHGTQVNIGIGGGYIVLEFESRSVVDTAAPSSVTVDMASQPIPLPSRIQQTATGATWMQTTGGTADVRRLTWQAITPTKRVRWFLVEPYDGQPTAALSLPASHAAEDPTLMTGVQLKGALVFYDDYDTVNGFTLSPPAGSYRLHWAVSASYDTIFGF